MRPSPPEVLNDGARWFGVPVVFDLFWVKVALLMNPNDVTSIYQRTEGCDEGVGVIAFGE